ncbi:MAG: DUF1631 domain-containing protein [Gammaproteobacteria bacterium]|nr:DUF1631 domain-containing protein [Gammaproteobacteria bacterium]MCF6229873.1 DUF1631 domain-containing protein [Gammaproteobacteria bacterium]
MSLPELMPVEELFAYDPSRAGTEVSFDQSELECARAIVDQELSIRFDESVLPEEVVSLLNDAWKEVLAAIYIEEGFGSLRWILAMEITDELVWTLQPKQNLAERTKMIGLLPTLVKVLRQGLASVKWDQQQTKQLLDDLSCHHMLILRGGKLRQPHNKVSAAATEQTEALPEESSATDKKGWHYRADINEWVYQDEAAQPLGASSVDIPAAIKKTRHTRTRKVGYGDR